MICCPAGVDTFEKLLLTLIFTIKKLSQNSPADFDFAETTHFSFPVNIFANSYHLKTRESHCVEFFL